jgi:hypothetical protein
LRELGNQTDKEAEKPVNNPNAYAYDETYCDNDKGVLYNVGECGPCNLLTLALEILEIADNSSAYSYENIRLYI